MKKLKILLVLFLIILLSSCQEKVHYKEYQAFGTYINVGIYSTSEEPFNYVTNLINKLNKLTDKYIDYSNTIGVYYINNHQGEEIVIDEDLFNIISLSIDKRILRDETSSYFEIGIGKISDIYKDIFDNYNGEAIDSNIYPNENVLNQKYLTDSSLITLNRESFSIIVPIGMNIDLGGITKGYLIDKLIQYFNSINVKYVIDAGRSSITTNTINKNKGNYYTVGLINPTDTNKTYKTLYLKNNKVLSTSGYYQKYFIYNDKIHSHILDPLTNRSIETDILSISILTDSGVDGDILSTVLYMMGSTKAIDYMNNNFIEGIIYKNDGSIIESNGIKDYIK